MSFFHLAVRCGHSRCRAIAVLPNAIRQPRHRLGAFMLFLAVFRDMERLQAATGSYRTLDQPHFDSPLLLFWGDGVVSGCLSVGAANRRIAAQGSFFYIPVAVGFYCYIAVWFS